MQHPEYMKVHIKNFPQDIIDKYNLNYLVEKDGYVYIKIKKGMYGLKQAALLAYNQLKDNLAKHGYHPIKHTIGLWKHDTRPITFCLCVDGFGIKYTQREDAIHLLNALKEGYTITTDWTGEHFCGLTLNQNYEKQYVDITMPDYVEQLLTKM